MVAARGDPYVEGAILFSEAHTIAQEHPDVVLALRNVLSRPVNVASQAHTFAQRLALLEHSGPTQEAAFALLQQLQERRTTLSYLEALGLLLAAATPPDAPEAPEPSPETVACASHIFDQIVERWAVNDRKQAAMAAMPLPPAFIPFALSTPVSPDEHELGSALSRALARSALEAEVKPSVPEVIPHIAPADTRRAAEPDRNAEPVPAPLGQPIQVDLAEIPGCVKPTHEATVEGSQERTPPQTSQASSSDLPSREGHLPKSTLDREDNSQVNSQLNAPKKRRLNPRLLVFGSLLFGLLLAFVLFRLGSRTLPEPASVPSNSSPHTARVAKSNPVVGMRPEAASRRSSAPPASEAPHERSQNSRTVQLTAHLDAPSTGIANPAAHVGISPHVDARADLHNSSGSLIPKAHAVILATPLPPSSLDGRLLGVTVGSAGAMAANVLESPAPVYPTDARAAHVQGEVIVEAVVGKNGEVLETRIVSGPALLQEAAQHAVQRWRYRPYLADGKPVEILATALIDFRLR